MDEKTKAILKEGARIRLEVYLNALDKGIPGTLIVTTDGEKYEILDSANPLPKRYLEQWKEDSRELGVDLSL